MRELSRQVKRNGWAVAARRRADQLAYHAETLSDREPCRNVAPEVDRLRGAAAVADQCARAVEAAVNADRPPRRRSTRSSPS